MWSRIRDWYSDVPPDLPAGVARIHIGAKIGYSVWTPMVGIMALVFLQLDQPVLAAFNGINMLLTAFCFFCFLTGRPDIGFVLVNILNIIGVGLTTVLIGLPPGFFLFALVGLLYCTLGEWVSRKVQWSLIIVSAAIFVGALIYGLNEPPLTPLTPRWNVIFAALNASSTAVILLMVGFSYRFAVDEAEAALEAEYQKSESLLHNVMPPIVAERLKQNPKVIADRHEAVTILFADIVGFTEIAGRLSAEDLVTLLNRLFTEFDGLAEEMGLEKIKTIGDAYLVVAGLPVPRDDHAEAVALFAREMVAATDRVSKEAGLALNVRIGIHTGPVVAGVIGRVKFAYDIWGDAVNIAARMESHGEAGRIHVSPDTAGLLKGRFTLEPRGSTELKGKGKMETFFLGPDIGE